MRKYCTGTPLADKDERDAIWALIDEPAAEHMHRFRSAAPPPEPPGLRPDTQDWSELVNAIAASVVATMRELAAEYDEGGDVRRP
jgi:hypothetical protein